MENKIRVEVHLYGVFKRFSAQQMFELFLPRGENVAFAKQELLKKLQDVSDDNNLGMLLNRSVFADEHSVLNDNDILDRDVEISILPPVSGG